MNYESLKNIISIPTEEKAVFKNLIRKTRAEFISTPSEIVENIFQENEEVLIGVISKHDISETIHLLREKTYESFLIEESDFNVEILSKVTRSLNTPIEIFNVIANKRLDLNASEAVLMSQIANVCGEYAGRISPYIYELCLSNTQSRRSRAGKTFEAIIYRLYEAFSYEFSSQKAVGKATFSAHGLGKMVDSLLPSISRFEQRRDKVIIGTMKTTLRERWQEVVEELQRTGLPSIHLLTMDDDISISKATQMGKHNVIIVVPKHVKNSAKLKEMSNIISFETYFLEEIPDMIRYWESQK